MECPPLEVRAMKPLSYVSLLMWLLASLCMAAEVEEPTEADWQAIQSVITSQLDAFKRDDAATAFSFASPAIQKMFHTPSEFMQMVRTGYSAVYRPGSVRFLDHFVVSGQAIQPLEVVDAEGDVIVAFYIMERQADGTWRIAGCKLEGSAAVSA
jgi:ketosteroid isomerase-like protein